MAKKDYASLKLSENNTIRLLQLYQGEPCLYDFNTEYYRNRGLRKAALKRIAAALAVDGFGPREVAAKFKNLRNSYSQEMKKAKDSEMSAGGTEDIYVPKVYWFSVMDSFIRPYLYSRPTHTDMVLKHKSVTKKATSPEHDEDGHGDEQEDRILDQISPPVIRVDESNTKCLLKRDYIQDVLYEGEDSQRVVQEETCAVSKLRGIKRKRSIPAASNKQADTSTMERLYEISRLAASIVSKKCDMYSYFGDYITSVLRETGGQKAVLMQRDICNAIFKHLSPHVSSKTASPCGSSGNGSSQGET